MDWSHWWYKQAADVVLPSTALAIGSKMSDKHTSSSIIQVENLWKTISVEEKLDVINQPEKGLWIVDICCNVWFAHSSVRTIPDNADKIKESAKSWTKCLCTKTTWGDLLQWTALKVMDVSLLNLNFRNIYVVYIQYILYKSVWLLVV